MSPNSLKTTDSSQDLEFRSIWEELYNPKDPDCPVRLAIRNTAWRHRPDHIWKQDFEGALPGRMYQKLRANFYNAKKSGMPPHVWRTKIGKLTKTAKSAAKDERNYIIEGARSKCKPKFDQLDTSDLPAASKFNKANSSEPDNPTPALSMQCNPLVSGDSHDPCDFVRRFVIEGFQSPTFHTDLEHIRSCDSCLNLFQKVAAEFAKLSDLQAVDRECACLLRKLGMWRNATELLLAVLDIIEQQLVLLGYSIPGRQAENGNPTMYLVVPDSAEERQQIIRGTMREGLAIAYNLRSLGYRGPLRRPLPASSRKMSAPPVDDVPRISTIQVHTENAR